MTRTLGRWREIQGLIPIRGERTAELWWKIEGRIVGKRGNTTITIPLSKAQEQLIKRMEQ